jgi:hypothetical protein
VDDTTKQHVREVIDALRDYRQASLDKVEMWRGREREARYLHDANETLAALKWFKSIYDTDHALSGDFENEDPA